MLKLSRTAAWLITLAMMVAGTLGRRETGAWFAFECRGFQAPAASRVMAAVYGFARAISHSGLLQGLKSALRPRGQGYPPLPTTITSCYRRALPPSSYALWLVCERARTRVRVGKCKDRLKTKILRASRTFLCSIYHCGPADLVDAKSVISAADIQLLKNKRQKSPRSSSCRHTHRNMHISISMM